MTYKLFTTNTCAYCPMVKKLLEYKKKDYQVIDVTDNESERLQLVLRYGALTVPVLVRDDGEFAIGYNQSKIMQLL
jgi:glutaredoxin